MKPSELIRQRGWCQGAEFCLCGTQRAFSAMGAIKVCKADQSKVRRLTRSLPKLPKMKFPTTRIDYWQNMPGRTAEEVIAKLEEFDL